MNLCRPFIYIPVLLQYPFPCQTATLVTCARLRSQWLLMSCKRRIFKDGQIQKGDSSTTNILMPRNGDKSFCTKHLWLLAPIYPVLNLKLSLDIALLIASNNNSWRRKERILWFESDPSSSNKFSVETKTSRTIHRVVQQQQHIFHGFLNWHHQRAIK